jgi:serine protease
VKKWVIKGALISASAALMVPTVVAAAEFSPLEKEKTLKQPDLLKELLKGEKEQKMAAYKKQQETMKEQLSTDTLIVKYESKLSRTIHRKAGTKVIRSIPALGYDVVQLSKGQKMQDVMRYYAQQDGVTLVQPSVTYKQLGFGDPKKDQMYHLDLLQIDKALELAGDHEVTVAVIDTGIDFNHPDLKAQVLPPYNAVEPANATFTDVHGTHVSGIIASTADNGVGGHGISPKAKILPIDVFNGAWGASDYVIAEAILYAVEHGADVINMSLGGYFNSPVLEEAVQRAIDAGVTVVAAAGNESWDEYSIPASYEGVISVGATNDKNELAVFSNYGPSVDLVAPGEAIYNTVYDYLKGGSAFEKLSGTSMASPVVAGVAALLKSKYPDLKPYEVEAILERTATDLGEKGYDLKYANGLVNPVKALQYDISQLPKRYDYNEDDLVSLAEKLSEDGPQVKKGVFAQPEEIHWYKIDLQKGEYVQTVLEGAKKYDYAMEFYFYPSNGKDKEIKPLKVNDVKAGATEGYLYKAEEDGTLVIGVKDANGNYSTSGKSTYTFTAEKVTELQVDEASKENLMPLAIPYNSSEDENGPFTLASTDHETDKDYFTFTVDTPQLISFDLAAIPGVNASLAVYFKEDLEMEYPEDLPPYEFYGPYPIGQANQGGIGEGEKLVFEAMPGIEYVLEVSNESNYFFFDPFYNGLFPDMSTRQSNIPYTLTADVLQLPPDEDGIPMEYGMLEEKFIEGDITEEQYKEKKREQFETFASSDEEEMYWNYMEPERVNMIMSNAVPYEIGQETSAYFQQAWDEDHFIFTAPSDAIYELGIEAGENQFLWATLFEYDEKHNDLIPIADISIYNYLYLYGGLNNEELKQAVALEKDKTYVLRVVNESYGSFSAEPYTIQSKKLMKNPEEKDTDENEMIRAKTLNLHAPTENYFIYQDDIDFYYYKHRDEEGLLSLQITPEKLSKEDKMYMPKSLQNELIIGGVIVEDTNGNMIIDEEESRKALYFEPSYLSTSYEVNKSFKVKKNAGYFIVAYNYNWGRVSIKPYQIQLLAHTGKDEDAGSTVTNNIPSKPIVLKGKNGQYDAKGLFNAGFGFGDKDFYQLTLSKDAVVSFTLKTDETLDGKVAIYDQNGTLQQEFDYYGTGDSEEGTLHLKKGTYYIEVSESLGRASSNPYELKVNVE